MSETIVFTTEPTLCLWRLIVFCRRTLAVAHFLHAITDATGDEGTQAAVDGNAWRGLHAGLREEHMGRGDEADCEGDLEKHFSCECTRVLAAEIRGQRRQPHLGNV